MKKTREFTSVTDCALSSIKGSLKGTAIWLGVIAVNNVGHWIYEARSYDEPLDSDTLIDTLKESAKPALEGAAVGTGIALVANLAYYAIKHK